MPRQRRRIVDETQDEEDDENEVVRDIDQEEDDDVDVNDDDEGNGMQDYEEEEEKAGNEDEDLNFENESDNDMEMPEEKGTRSNNKKTKKSSNSSNNKNSSSRKSKRKTVVASDDEEMDGDGADTNFDDNADDARCGGMRFSSQIPDMTQDIDEVKLSERNNLERLSTDQQRQVIQNLTRYVLFMGLSGEAIDRTKFIKDSGIDVVANNQRITTAVFDEVNTCLRNIFDFELIRQPEWMNKIKGCNTAKYIKDRYYLVNAIQDSEDLTGIHSKSIHAVHESTSIEKGLLMIILAFAYCKGTPRTDGSRWILDKHLYHLLHKVDENIPSDPPRKGVSSGGTKRTGNIGLSQSNSSNDGGGGVGETPNVDAAIEKFVKRDYLLREKATEEIIADADSNDIEEDSLFYTMGPRAAAEIGRKQVVYFCAEILDEEPDPTMLAEVESLQSQCSVVEENE